MKRILVAIVIFICLFYFPLAAQQETGRLSSSTKSEDDHSKILVCSKVFEALGKISDPQAKEVLIKGLKSKEFFIRAYAAQALGRLKAKEAVNLLKELTNDENYLVRIFATAALVELGDTEIEKLLLSFLNDDKPEIRANTVEQLGYFKNKYLSNLAELLSKDNNYLVRQKVIEQLGVNKFSPAITIIRKALKDENEQIRRAACFALGQIGDKKDIPLLRERLTDNDVSVCAEAKQALSLLGEKSLIKLFWRDVENKDPLLQISSYLALANLKDINILPLLLKEVIAEENTGFSRIMAARALMIIKSHVLESVKQALIKSKAKIISTENLEVGYKVNGKNLTFVFIEALKDENSPLHRDAPIILTELRDEVSLLALREALFQEEEDPEIVASVAYALGAFRDKDAVGDLIKISEKYGF